MGNLSLPTIAQGQLSMYQTSNDADNALDLAMTDLFQVDLSSANVTITAAQMVRAISFQCSGNAVPRTLTFPAARRFFFVQNAGSDVLTVALGSTTFTVAANDSAVFYADGTADGLATVVASSGASGGAGGDLTGTYPNPTIGAGKVSLAKMANLAADSIVGNNTGSPATPLALTVSQAKALLAIAAGDVSGLAVSATTDTTDASNISSGTLSNSRLSGVELSANKGAANGYAPLDSGSKVPLANLPSAVAGALSYQGTWNANTNSPTLVSSTGTQGYFYKVSVAGTTSIDSHSHWNLGDIIVFDGTVWDKLDGIESEVVSVVGKTGVVTVAIGDLDNIADARIVGNNSGGAGPPIVLTASQVKALLAIAAGDVSGLASSATTDTTSATNITSGTLPDTRLSNTAVTAGSYGDGTHVGSFTVDAHGRLTAAANVTITGAAPTGSAGGDLTGTYPNPTLAATAVTATSYGDASHVASFTVDAKGRLTAASAVAIAISSGAVSGLAGSATTDTTNASNISSGTLAAARLAAIRYDISTYYPGIPGNSQLLLRWQAPRAVTIPSGGTGSQASSAAAATGSTTFTIKQGGSSVGTIVWSSSGTTGAFTISSAINLAAGDVLTITGPASADATIADISIVLAGTA